MEERSIVSEDDEQETNSREQRQKKSEENYSLLLRVVVSHAFIKPPRPNYDNMSIIDLENRLSKINEDKPDKLEKEEDDYRKELKDILTIKEESAVLKKNAKIAVSMILKFKKSSDYLTCDIPLKSTQQNNYLKRDNEEDSWKTYGKGVPPARSEFGLIHFPSSYRFDFRNIDKEHINSVKYLEIRLLDSESSSRLATSKIRKVKVKNKDEKGNETVKSIPVREWLQAWLTSGNKTQHICFSEEATPFDPLKPRDKNEDKTTSTEESEEVDESGSDEEKESEEGSDIQNSSEVEENDNDEDNNEKTESENYNTWIKVNLFLFSMDDEKDLHVPNCSENRKKNEYPVMLNKDDIEMIKIYSIKPLKLMFVRFQTALMRDEIIHFAIERCHYSIFNQVLALCLQKSDDPLKTALEASELCKKRKEQVNGGTENWEQKSVACLKIAITIGGTIPKIQEKLQDTHYYEAAARHILDQNLVIAVENDMIEVLHSNVFADRSYQRWWKRGMKIFPFFPKISPCMSFLGQGLLFFMFCIIFTYLSSTSYQIYNLNWTSGFDNNMFGIEGVSPPNFWDIDDSTSFYNWMESMLVPQIFSDTANYSSSPTALYWYLITPSVVVRQIRVKPQNCSYVSNLTCYENLMDVASGAVEDRDPQYAGYNFYPDLGGLYLLGVSPNSRYHTGGYAVFLNGSQTDVLGQIAEMKNKSYIDPGTRAVIIEFAIFSPNAGLFMMFEILVEFTHIGVVNLNRAMVVQQPLSSGQLEVQSLSLFYVLTAFIIGYILQEGAEMAVTCHSRVKELERRDQEESEENNDIPDTQSKNNDNDACCTCCVEPMKKMCRNNACCIHCIESMQGDDDDACCTCCVKPIKEIGGDPFSRIVKAAMHTFIKHYTGDVWNILDFFINSTVVMFLILVYIQHFAFNFVPNSDTQFIEIHNLWISEIIIETADITASIGLVMSWLRVLYFTLPIKTVGPLVIGMLRMYKDVLYFIFLMTVFLFGFTTAFDIIFAGYLEIDTGYGIAGFNTLLLSLGNINYADSSNFLELPLKWFGNALIIVYVLISSIILVNLLISMMGGTYENLQKTIDAKWRHLCGELLLHYERFVLMPPPLNIPHIMLYSMIKGIPPASKILLSEGRWKLVGSWRHDEEWKIHYRKILRRDRLSNQPGPYSIYSTIYYDQIILDEIDDAITEGIEKNHLRVIKHIKHLWAKDIEKRTFTPEQLVILRREISEKVDDMIKKKKITSDNKEDEVDETDDPGDDELDELDETDEPGDDDIANDEDIIKTTIKNVEERSWMMWYEGRKKVTKMKKINMRKKIKKEMKKEKGATSPEKPAKPNKRKQSKEQIKLEDFWKAEDSSSVFKYSDSENN